MGIRFVVFCDFPVACVRIQSIAVAPLGASEWCIGRIISG